MFETLVHKNRHNLFWLLLGSFVITGLLFVLFDNHELLLKFLFAGGIVALAVVGGLTKIGSA